MEFTQAQSEAIYTHDRNLIVVAGAGSGKTRVLVERYLALLDANPDWSLGALVAITFTKKAAEEMRDRVRKALEDRYYQVISPHEMDRWSRLLSEIDSARIDTIHGLCATILRSNAAEAGVDPDFVVLDEVEAAILLDDVIDLVLADLAVSEHPAVELLTEYDARDVRAMLSRPDLLAVRQIATYNNLFEQWQAAWWESVPVRLNGFMQIVESLGMVSVPDDEDRLAELWRGCLGCLDRMLDGDDEAGYNALHDIAAMSIGNAGKASIWGDKEAAAAARETLMQIRTAAKATLATMGDPPGELDRRASELLPHWTMLVRTVQAFYHEAKASQSALDFDDLERMTCDLLQRYPDVQRRYRGAEFRHVLVDEFQDTNAAQWQIVQALTGLDVSGSLFVVGDPKQSIYAFRGADVSVFGSVFEQIRSAGGDDKQLAQSFRTHQPLVDGFNAIFRKLLVRDSVDPLVSGYQVEFGVPMEAFRQNPPDRALAAIELLLIEQVERDEQGQASGDRLNAEARREWEAFEIAQRVHQMVHDGRLVYDKAGQRTRPIQYDDVAILFQSLSNVTLYETVFKSVGLPFITLAGRGYYDRQEVWDLLNLLQAVYNPADNLSLASVLRSPMFGLSDDALLALRLSGRRKIDEHERATQGTQHAVSLPDGAETGDERGAIVDLWEALADPGDLLPDDEREAVEFARECLVYLRSIAGRVTISELLREALQYTGYLAILTGLPDGARRRGNVEKLLEKAETSGKVTLGAFSQYLRDLSAREVREGEAAVDVAGAVQIMTVHASKGLEFPLVVLADASWDRGSGNRECLMRDPDYGFACKVYDVEQDKHVPTYRFRMVEQIIKQREAAERLRLLYVAATRAQDYLLVCGQVQESKGVWRSGGWLGRLMDVLELGEALNPCMDTSVNCEWGQVRVTLPRCRPDDSLFAATTVQLDWDVDWSSVQPLKPELLADVPVQLEQQARHLAATHIADLGSAELDTEDRWFYRQRFRRQVLQDVPTVVEWVSQDERRPSARQVGEIVHEALRHWRIPGQGDDASLRQMLYSYAWRQGITDDLHCTDAMNRAYQLLIEFKNSDVYQWVESAQTVYRELPFVYERQGRTIHGIIDVLFRMPDGRWVVADYKTSTVKPFTPDAVIHHARRYHLQIGVYADAVQNQLGGIVPETYIHYIRYSQTVRIEETAWRGALSRSLTERILELFEGQ